MAIESIIGTAAADSLQATITADSVTANLTEDFVVDALAGNDTIKVLESATNFTIAGGTGADTILFDKNVEKAAIQGAADNDTLRFAGSVDTSTVYGGKGADTMIVTGSVTASKFGGSKGDDTITFSGKVIDGSIVTGDEDDDQFTFSDRLDDSSIYGGKGEDQITASSIVAKGLINGDKGDDRFTISGTTSGSTFSGGEGLDTLTVTGNSASSDRFLGGADIDSINADGTGAGQFYGGQGGDTLTLGGNSTVLISGDKGDDTIDTDAVTAAGASLLGGAGADTVDATNHVAASTLNIQGGEGADSLMGGVGSETMTGGAGDDVLHAGADDGGAGNIDVLYGGQGADTITVLDTNSAVSIFGDAGNDVILASAAVAGTIKGGAGSDSIQTEDEQELIYDSFAEFVTGGALVDSIDMSAAGDALNVEIAGALNIATTTTFTGFVDTRTAEGLKLNTTTAVTGQSSVTLSAAAGNAIGYIDISDGTTAASLLDASLVGLVMSMEGGAGADTIKGGAAADSLQGGAGADTIIGNGGDDTIVSGTGADTLTGGAGADDYMFSDNLTSKTITDMTIAADDIGLDISNIQELSTLNSLTDLDGAAIAANAMVMSGGVALNAQYDLAGAAGDELLQIDTNFADASALQTNVRAFLKAGGVHAADSGILASYDDGTDSYLAVISTGDGVAANALFDDGVVTNIAKIVGLANNTTLTAAEFLNLTA